MSTRRSHLQSPLYMLLPLDISQIREGSKRWGTVMSHLRLIFGDLNLSLKIASKLGYNSLEEWARQMELKG